MVSHHIQYGIDRSSIFMLLREHVTISRYFYIENNSKLKLVRAKDTSTKKANIIIGPGVRIIKSCSSDIKSSQV